MIHKVKTVTWEVRSHGQETTISSKGIIENWTFQADRTVEMLSKAKIKKIIWHLEDVLKCMNRIEKEKQARKERKKDRDFAEKVIDKLVKEDKARQI